MLRELLPGINEFWNMAVKMKIYKSLNKYVLLLAVVALHGPMSGCATTAATDPRDPWESMNRGTQSFNDSLDEHVLDVLVVASLADLVSRILERERRVGRRLMVALVALSLCDRIMNVVVE